MVSRIRNLTLQGLLQHPSTAILAGILCVAAMLPYAHAQVSQKPFSKDDVITLLKGSVSPKRVIELVQQRGIDFVVTPEVERQLRKLGATDSLIAKLKESAPKPAVTVPMPAAPVPAPTPQPAMLEIHTNPPAGAEIYVDDQPQGYADAEGRLRIQDLLPGQHRLRLNLIYWNFESYEENVDLVSGPNIKSLTLVPANPTTFQVFHDHGGDLRKSGAGFLKVSKDGLELSEIVKPGRFHGGHAFKVSCADIVEVNVDQEPGWFHVRLGSKNYRFTAAPPNSSFEVGNAMFNKEESAAIVAAILSACGQR